MNMMNERCFLNILFFFESNKYFITKLLLVEFILRVKKAMGRERNELLYLFEEEITLLPARL
jgi:hypothetical protein